jgi:endo-1,4-beta-xylanase
LILLISLSIAALIYWPREYKKSYIGQEGFSSHDEHISLRQMADSAGFRIGMTVRPDSLSRYFVPCEFNSVTADKHFKPGPLLKDPESWTFDFSVADTLLKWAEAGDMRMRGHTLIWGKFAGMTYPKIWQNMIDDSPDPSRAMKEIMQRYITMVMEHFKGRVGTWDIVNEPLGGIEMYPSIFFQTLGEEYIDFAFHTAHRVDPECELFLNEQIVDYSGPQGDAFLKLLERLLERSVPVHGVGLQTHQINKAHDPEELGKYIRAIGEMGLKVEITELDIKLRLFAGDKHPYEAQGEHFYAIVKVCLNEPACQGVTFWGLTDRQNWMDGVPPFKWTKPNAPHLLDEDLYKKPAYFGVWNALNESLVEK